MLRKKKILTAALCAGGVVLSAALTAAETTIVSQPFGQTGDVKTFSLPSESVTWDGYGSVTNQTVGYTKPTGVGSPINTAEDKLYLSVEGQVTCTAATVADKPATVDMMFQIAKPDEELALPSGENKDDIQIALGVEKDGTLKAYCKNRDGNTGWYTIDETPHAEGAWHRVSFTFDYGHKTCQIRLDGEPLMTKYGSLTSDGTGAANGNGSWYKLNTPQTVKNLSSLKVVGSTAIDEVVIKQAVSETASVTDVLPALADVGGTTGGVPNQWIAEQGITRAQAEATTLPDNSGMSALEKYQTGLSVGDGKTYVITAMEMMGEGDNNLKATLTVPAMTPPVGRRNVIVYGADPQSLTAKQVISSGATSVVLDVNKATSGVTKIYYQLKNEPVAQQ